MPKKQKLDKATINIMQRLLNMPPKVHEDMKVGRTRKKKKRGSSTRAASSKQRNA